jgi:hypothetical protein
MVHRANKKRWLRLCNLLGVHGWGTRRRGVFRVADILVVRDK